MININDAILKTFSFGRKGIYKAGFTASKVACGWAGAVMEHVNSNIWAGAVMQKTPKNAVNAEKGNRVTDYPTDGPTNIAGCRVASTRLKSKRNKRNKEKNPRE